MKKFIVFGLLFLSLNGLHATEEPTPELSNSIALRQWCDEHGGESCARLFETWAQNVLGEVRMVRLLIAEEEEGVPFENLITHDCLARQDCALRLLWLLQEAGYPSESQRS